jgi:hypothetical protein
MREEDMVGLIVKAYPLYGSPLLAELAELLLL